jgi:DNA-binding CsgD family transcriptional regulator
MTRRFHHAERVTDREVGVVAAVLVAGSEKAAAHRLGLSRSTVKHHLANARSRVGAETTAQLVWILAPRLPEAEGGEQTEERSERQHGGQSASGVSPPSGQDRRARAVAPEGRR